VTSQTFFDRIYKSLTRTVKATEAFQKAKRKHDTKHNSQVKENTNTDLYS